MALKPHKRRRTAGSLAHTEDLHVSPKPAADSPACKPLKVSRSTQIHRFNRRIQTLPVKFVNEKICSVSAAKSTHAIEVQTSAQSCTVSPATSDIPYVSDSALPAINQSVQTSDVVLCQETSASGTTSVLISEEALTSDCDRVAAVKTLSTTTQSSISTIDTAQDVTNPFSKDYIPPHSEPILVFFHQVGNGFEHQSTPLKLFNGYTQKHHTDSRYPVYQTSPVDSHVEKRKYAAANSLDSAARVLSSSEWSSHTTAKSSFAAASSDRPSGDRTMSSTCPPLCLSCESHLPKLVCPHISRSTQTSVTDLVSLKHFPIIISNEPLDKTNGHSTFLPGLVKTAESQVSWTDSRTTSGDFENPPLRSLYTDDEHLTSAFDGQAQTSSILYTQSLIRAKISHRSNDPFIDHSAQTELYSHKFRDQHMNFDLPEEQNNVLRSDPKLYLNPSSAKRLEGQIPILTRRQKLSNSLRIVPNNLHSTLPHMSYSADVRFVSRSCQTEPCNVNSVSLICAENGKSKTSFTSYSQYTEKSYEELSQKPAGLGLCGRFRNSHSNVISARKLSSDIVTMPQFYDQVGKISDSFTVIPRPPAVICYICGREYGTASISIHQKQCLEMLRKENSELPPHLQRSEPMKPQLTIESAQAIRGTKSGCYDLSAINCAAFAALQVQYVPCEVCGRTFLPESLQVHARSCRGFSRRKKKQI